MVKYSLTDLISIRDFAFVWRITDARWDTLPTDVLERIRPLSARRSKEVCELSSVFQNVQTRQVSEIYQISRRTSPEGITPSDRDRIAGWLVGLPIQQSECVYVCWSNMVAIVVEWSVFIQIWDSLWYPFDHVFVFDETLDWAVVFGPEELAVYIDRIGAVG